MEWTFIESTSWLRNYAGGHEIKDVCETAAHGNATETNYWTQVKYAYLRLSTYYWSHSNLYFFHKLSFKENNFLENTKLLQNFLRKKKANMLQVFLQQQNKSNTFRKVWLFVMFCINPIKNNNPFKKDFQKRVLLISF